MILALLGLLLNTTPANAIIGGVPVSQEDEIAKSTVLLYGQTGSGSGFICTGTILNSQYILSAAHCVTDVKAMYVFFTTDGSTGDKMQAMMKDKTRVRQVVGINHNIDYPNNTVGSMYPHNDVALVRFAGGIPSGFKPAIVLNPAVMANYLKPGVDLVIAGFGQRSGSGSETGTLYKNTVKIQKIYPKTLVVGEAGSSACHGDSGGPAFISIGGTLYLVAALSRGEAGCVSSATYSPLTSNLFAKMGTPAL